MGKAGLKAGLIGAAIMLVLTLLSQIKIEGLACLCCPVTLLAYAGIGVLAGYFLTPQRTAGSGAGAGAIAGLVGGVLAGLVWTIVIFIQMRTASVADILSSMPADTLRQLQEANIDPEQFARSLGTWAPAIGGGLCCLGSLALGAGLGAIGGAIFSTVKPD
ncbi:MAG: hypothetical protein N2508_02885 [Anaerolineae bacterium]|nr:hypothetical protein [Anaerolineae bacterium]